MTFKFACPYCGQRISATVGQLETTGVCPACDRDVEVPSGPAVEAAPVEIAEAASSPHAPPPAVATEPVRAAEPLEAPEPVAAPEPVLAPEPVADTEPPRPAPQVVPVVTPKQKAPARPAKPAAAPVPVRRPARRYTPPDLEEPWEEEMSRPGLPIFTLLLCAIPIPGLILLRKADLLDVAPFGILLAGSGFLCFLGIIAAHRAWWRSKRRFSARALSFVSLLVGYLSAFVIGCMVLALDTGRPAVAKQNDEPPDFKAGDGTLAKTEPPDLTPKGGELAKAEPPVKPMAGEPAKLEPAAAPPAMASTATDGAADPTQFFEGKIRPILVDKCYKCHSEETGKSKGGLTLDTRDALLKGGDTGPGITPGDPEASLLIKAVLYSDENLQMPPKGDKLNQREIADLTAWVKMGAPYSGKAK